MSSHNPLVTVVVPNYNYAPTLGRCLRAIREQTYSPLEILVADDCSTDDSVAVAKSMGVKVVSPSRNGGQAVARNLGAAHARGEILFFVDSDLVIEPDAVANAVAILDADPKVGAICGIEDPVPLIRDKMIKEYRALQYHYWSLTPDGIVSFLFSAMFAIRADVWAEVGPFDPRLRWSEEVEYGHRLSRNYQIRLTADLRGRHDPDDSLRGMLRKLFHRGRVRVPLYARKKEFAQGFETASRVWSSVAAFFAVVSVALPVVLGWPWALVPVALLALSIAADAGMYGFVRAERGPLFLFYYAGIHFLVNLTISAAAIAGLCQWMTSGKFRSMYDDPPKPLSWPTLLPDHS
ncbi:glycosyltransferase family 2 protein [Nonomuraea rhizosphaerae]|uniref:glycosyltransferase family 2 protein n=1 Tax=Nonomuraea rhizosphaerae TaxID=2665663 RepID=UPI001C5FD1FF|nr:glycosyltransferase family 2 protein [Nonomuraea rhizosphaerae]